MTVNAADAARIGALADDTRRALFALVGAEREPVSRERAASALGIPVHTVAFHLDRLVAEGLLEVEFRRLTGRSGPGAGRPSKLYRRTGRAVTVSVPPRRYDLAGEILATAVERATGGEPLAEAIEKSAYAAGRALGVGSAAAVAGSEDPRRAGPASGQPLPGLAAALTAQGFEPRVDGGVVDLASCPFEALAKRHRELVCGLNRSYVRGVLDGLGLDGARACLEPEPGRCCVRVHAPR